MAPHRLGILHISDIHVRTDDGPDLFRLALAAAESMRIPEADQIRAHMRKHGLPDA